LIADRFGDLSKTNMSAFRLLPLLLDREAA